MSDWPGRGVLLAPRGAEKVGEELKGVRQDGGDGGGSSGSVREGKVVDVTTKLGAKGNRRNRRGRRGKKKKREANGVEGNETEGMTSEHDQTGTCAEKSGGPRAWASAGSCPGNERELRRESGGGDAECLSMLECVSGEEIGPASKRRRKEGKTEEETENEGKTTEQSQREKGIEARKRSVKKPIVRVTVREDDDSSPAACAGCWYYHLRM